MKKCFLVLSFLAVLVACNSKQENKTTQTQVKDTIAAIKMPQELALTDRARNATDEWTNYKEFENEMDNLSKTAPSDFYTTISSLLKIEVEMEQDTMPKVLDETSVKTRFLVIKTYLLEALSLEEFKANEHQINAQKAKIFTAYNSLKEDLNDVADPKIIDDFLKDENQFIKRDSTITQPNQNIP
ncbi:hypothetical protein ACG2LH_04010 [Zhouia sp. PK063]|uniref:hypothetical protein n=1 Tax=Zhouia sp. PK063 TaxID=3373602 RepID=UPI0037A78CF0